jgi:hypothetical protein
VKNRYLYLICLITLVSLILTACTGGASSTTSTTSSTSTTTTQPTTSATTPASSATTNTTTTSRTPSATGSNLPVDTVGVVKVSTAPQQDGQVESLWSQANPVTIQAMGGNNFKNSSTTIELRSVYTNDSIYFLAQWTDDTQSLRRMPWQKQADGSWKQMLDPNDKGGDNNITYEDKLALIWNINDSIANFNSQGCSVACHAGEAPKPFGNKYTSAPGELGDIWHWKSVRTGSVSQIDDQYLDNTHYDPANAPDAGRKSDPKTGGGYIDNKTQDGKLPAWAAPDNKPAPPFWIMDSQKVAFDDSRYQPDD